MHLLKRFTIVLQPPCLVLSARVAVRPVNDSSLGVPLVDAIECNDISGLQPFNSGSEVDIVRDEQSLSRRESKDEALMTTPVVVIG